MFEGSKKRKLDHNTVLVQTQDGFGVQLHGTVVVEYLPEGAIKLNSGGWLTTTTKDRLNKFSPFRIFQSKYEWFIENTKGKIAFHDGICLPSEMAVLA